MAGADVKFTTTVGTATNVITDNGDGTYTAAVDDLANPNISGLSSLRLMELARQGSTSKPNARRSS